MQKCTELEPDESVFYRDQLRAARYAALADSEGFREVCYALEGLGLRLHGQKADLGSYKDKIKYLAEKSEILIWLTKNFPGTFTEFDALFDLVRIARNDAMHTGAYARHATASAIELCIGLEAALMNKMKISLHQVKHYMVKSPIIVEPWQPVARARQLMLTHSFSFLPVKTDSWNLISETSMARYLKFGTADGKKLNALLGSSIASALSDGLVLIKAQTVGLDDEIHTLLQNTLESPQNEKRLWLVEDASGHLCGVLSPFELM